jgi:putative nucleotidyltransferase with HDIG domain
MRHEDPPVEAVTRPAPPARAPSRAVVPWLAAGSAAAALAIGALTVPHSIAVHPWMFLALVAGVALLDLLRLDVFDRARISPASIPVLALGALFGPLGPMAGEALIAVRKLVRRDPLVPIVADFGCLSLAGAAAAGVYSALPHATDGTKILAATGAGMAYYVANIALLGPLVSVAQRMSLARFVRETYQWLWPHYLVFGALAGVLVVSQERVGVGAVALFGLPVLMLWVAEKQYLDRSRSSVTQLRRSHAELEAANERLRGLLDEKQDLLQTVHRSYLSTITSLARTIEAKDPYTGDHTERVATIAHAIALEMGFDEEELRAIEVGAVIHDIGKIGVPDRVLLKPGALDDEEFAAIKKHPEISSYILAELDLPPIVKQMVRNHHERFDGRGYPDGLAGDEIPLAARILTAADALDAMTSDRPYRAALTYEAALAEIASCSGAQFCPSVVEALDALLRRNPAFLAETDAAQAASAA